MIVIVIVMMTLVSDSMSGSDVGKALAGICDVSTNCIADIRDIIGVTG